MTYFELSQSQENLTSHSGLALFGAAFEQTQLDQRVNQFKLAGAKREPDISHSDILKSYIGLLGLGQSDYEQIEPFRGDELVFKLPLGLEAVPSSATLRQRLNQLATMAAAPSPRAT